MDPTPLALLTTAVFAPVAAGLASLLTTRESVATRTLIALLGPLVSVAALGTLWAEHGLLDAPVGAPLAPAVELALTFRADALGMFFALLVSGVGALIVLYARGYFGADARSLARFYPILGFFASAMLGLVLADNMIALLLFWEMTSVSSFLLIGWERESRRAVRLALQALIVTGLGGLALLGGVLLLGGATGEWSLAAAAQDLANGAVVAGWGWAVPWALGLIFVGCATKSAQWPFHFWLPGAMAAPTPVSAYLHSATMVKAGVYLIARLYPALHGLSVWTPALVAFGAVTMLLGAVLAFRSDELKRIFAYTTVSQLGLFVCMYGLGAAAGEHGGEGNLVWPVAQILNHALYKAPLFIIAGAIIHIAGRAHLSQLRGFVRERPLLAWICLLGCYALAGGPLTFSFAAKEAFFEMAYAASETHPWLGAVVAMAVATAMCNVAIFIRFLTTFFAKPSQEESAAPRHGHAPERGFWGACIWWPAALLVAAQFVFGAAPALLEATAGRLETYRQVWDHVPTVWHALSHPAPPLLMSAIAIGLGLLLGFAPFWRRPVEDPHNRLFPGAVGWLESFGARVHSVVQSGNVRVYGYIVTMALLLGLLGAAFVDPGLLTLRTGGPLLGAELGFVLAAAAATTLICVTAFSMPIVRSRIVRVLVLGSCGFSVTAMYLLYQAPDLALTQLMFELISIILFLLVLRMLPEEPKARPRGWTPPRVVTSAAAGLAIGWVVLQIAATVDERAFPPRYQEVAAADAGAPTLVALAKEAAQEPAAGKRPKLGDWFLARSYAGPDGSRGGGGENAVNVILVDFRGFDTLGEITVLSIAAMGVFAMIGTTPAIALRRLLRKRKAVGTGSEDVLDAAEEFACVYPGPQPSLTSSLFATSMRLILPLGLIFASYMFFRGHNAPGGGFIAGLVASVAIAVFRMAKGKGALKSLLPIKPAVLASMGLGLALATGAAPLFVGLATGQPLSFMHSGQAHIPLAGGEEFHLVSVMFFDLGVFFVVVAVSVGMLNRLTEELE
ncbi:MAG: DUF4040 domain-containing protein [Planctomycetota bacterium]|nr:MAG: DUF4040 domain-containing protein [Planctomycetota bacterium]